MKNVKVRIYNDGYYTSLKNIPFPIDVMVDECDILDGMGVNVQVSELNVHNDVDLYDEPLYFSFISGECKIVIRAGE